MLRRSFAAVFVLALMWSVSLSAQSNVPQRTVIVDINSAPEAEIAAVGIDPAIARKIVEGRPYRTKRDLVTRSFLTMEQYDKVKDSIVARQPNQR